jgi:hypothetical protein
MRASIDTRMNSRSKQGDVAQALDLFENRPLPTDLVSPFPTP